LNSIQSELLTIEAVVGDRGLLRELIISLYPHLGH
jgi:hypothetical protein